MFVHDAFLRLTNMVFSHEAKPPIPENALF